MNEPSEDFNAIEDITEVNRIMTRAGRRCARDLNHAADHIQDPVVQKIYKDRSRMWKYIFWDCQQYRDELHNTIDSLEDKIRSLEKQLKDAGIEPSPF